MASSPVKVAIVTGASSGIGRACAIALSKAGWSLALSGRRAEQLDETKQLCAGDAITVPGDVSDDANVAELFRKTVEAFGRVDLLFNNAGINAPQVPIEELSVDSFRKVMDANLTAAFICTQHAFRQFKAQSPQGGRIINNGSISAHTPRPMSAAYTASKHALLGLTKCIALDGRQFDITCTQIDIGNCMTDMGARLAQGTLQADGTIKAEAVYDAAHVASTIVHIASLPNSVQTLQITLMATNMPFVGRG